MVQRMLIIIALPLTLLGYVEILNVEPYANNHIEQKEIEMKFVCTADTITEAYFFLGKSVGSGYYHIEIVETQSYIDVDAHPDSNYCYIGGLLSPLRKYTKGDTYTLKITHSAVSGTVDAYVDTRNPYPHGYIVGHENYDLCARVWGRNDTSGEYFGLSGLSGSSCFSGLI